MTEPAVVDPPVGDGGLVRLRVDLSYDGSAFSGWAKQPGFRTVQAEVELALERVLRTPVVTAVAGRTDAGVHARAQVLHLDVPATAYAALVVDPGRVARKLGSALPPDIALRGIAAAPPGFDARFSAIWRRYAYRIADNDVAPDPLHRGWVLRFPRPLDCGLLNDAAALLLGEHDFAAFCRRREGATTIRTLLALSWRRDDSGLLVGTVRADAFCHSMVRALVGALLPVGDRRRAVDWPAAVLAGGVRHPAVTVAPAHPLVLEEVRYPPPREMAARAREARAVRALTPGSTRLGSSVEGL